MLLFHEAFCSQRYGRIGLVCSGGFREQEGQVFDSFRNGWCVFLHWFCCEISGILLAAEDKIFNKCQWRERVEHRKWLGFGFFGNPQGFLIGCRPVYMLPGQPIDLLRSLWSVSKSFNMPSIHGGLKYLETRYPGSWHVCFMCSRKGFRANHLSCKCHVTVHSLLELLAAGGGVGGGVYVWLLLTLKMVTGETSTIIRFCWWFFLGYYTNIYRATSELLSMEKQAFWPHNCAFIASTNRSKLKLIS